MKGTTKVENRGLAEAANRLPSGCQNLLPDFGAPCWLSSTVIRPADSRRPYSACSSDLPPRFPSLPKLHHLLSVENYSWSAHGFARAGPMQPGSAQPCSHPFRYSDTLLLGNPSGNRDHQFACRPRCTEVLFGVAYELNAVGREALYVLEGFSNPFAGEPVQCPDQNHIESTL